MTAVIHMIAIRSGASPPGRIQTKSACWREIEMIEEVLALCGAERKEKRADFGPSWRWTWLAASPDTAVGVSVRATIFG